MQTAHLATKKCPKCGALMELALHADAERGTWVCRNVTCPHTEPEERGLNPGIVLVPPLLVTAFSLIVVLAWLFGAIVERLR